MPRSSRKSNTWRDNYNPLRQLTVPRLLALFEQAERGAFSEIQLILRKAEKRFPIFEGVLFIEKLLSSIEELNWDIKINDPLPDGVTARRRRPQMQQYLRGRYYSCSRTSAMPSGKSRSRSCAAMRSCKNTFTRMRVNDASGGIVLD